jgi:UDP-N-acetylmuramoyl-L-alanine---L-glutamate ligase
VIFDDLRGKRVGVWGLGREGQAALRALTALGVAPVLVDDRPAGTGVLATGDGGLRALERCDVVLKTPGISRYRPEVAKLENGGVLVTSGLALWLAAQDLARVVLVTGTKGKSTTTSIIGHLLTGLGHPASTAGNIGTAPYDPGLDGATPEYWVVEVSSYQATDLTRTPPVTAVTSLHPDHLDWHGGVEQYYRDKLSACARPGADLTVANGDSDLLRSHRGLLGPRVDWVLADDAPDATWMDQLSLPGLHNRRNALIARRCIEALGVAVSDDTLTGAARGFRPLPSRLTTIAGIGGVTFVDDSLSTNVLPTLAALDAFPGRRIALIAGGHDRGIDYTGLAAGIAGRQAPTFVCTLPESGPRISAALAAAGFAATADFPDLAGAVRAAYRWAAPGGVVLLSPAAPSFGQFRDYRDRAGAFARAVSDIASCTQF